MQGCAICRGQWSRFEWGGLNFWAEVLLQYCHICEASHTKRPKYFFTPKLYLTNSKTTHYPMLVYTTQVNSTFCAHWLASSEVISQVLFTSEQPEKNKMAFVAIFSQKKLLFEPLVIQLMWYILKQLFTSVSVKVVDIYLAALRLSEYPPLFTSTSVNNC